MTEQVPAAVQPLLGHLESLLGVRKAITDVAREVHDAARDARDAVAGLGAVAVPLPREVVERQFAERLSPALGRMSELLPEYEQRLALVDADLRALVADQAAGRVPPDDRDAVVDALDALRDFATRVSGFGLTDVLAAAHRALSSSPVDNRELLASALDAFTRHEAAHRVIAEWLELLSQGRSGD